MSFKTRGKCDVELIRKPGLEIGDLGHGDGASLRRGLLGDGELHQVRQNNGVDRELRLLREAGLAGRFPGGLQDLVDDFVEAGLFIVDGVVFDEAAGAGGFKEQRGGQVGGGFDGTVGVEES